MRLTRRECVVYQGSSSPTPSPEEAAKLVEFISILRGPGQASSRTARRTQEKAKWGLVVCRVSCSARAQARRRGGPPGAQAPAVRTLPTLPRSPYPPFCNQFFLAKILVTDSIRTAIVTESGERERERGKVTWRSAVQLPLGAKMASRRGTGLSGRRRILRRAFKVDGTIECEIDSLSPPQAKAEATAGAAEPEMKGKMAAVVVLCHGQWSSKYGAWPVPVCRPAGASP